MPGARPEQPAYARRLPVSAQHTPRAPDELAVPAAAPFAYASAPETAFRAIPARTERRLIGLASDTERHVCARLLDRTERRFCACVGRRSVRNGELFCARISPVS